MLRLSIIFSILLSHCSYFEQFNGSCPILEQLMQITEPQSQTEFFWGNFFSPLRVFSEAEMQQAQSFPIHGIIFGELLIKSSTINLRNLLMFKTYNIVHIRGGFVRKHIYKLLAQSKRTAIFRTLWKNCFGSFSNFLFNIGMEALPTEGMTTSKMVCFMFFELHIVNMANQIFTFRLWLNTVGVQILKNSLF